MNKFLPITFAILLGLPITAPITVNAQTLPEALSQAYSNNPELAAAQAELRAIDSTVTEAQSGWRPRAELNASGGLANSDHRGSSDVTHPRGVTASVTQPIFRGGRTVAATDIARANVQAGRANLQAAEQNLLLTGATAYLDVLRDEAVLQLTENNQQVLQEQLNVTQSRFKVGEITRTDVSQAESRVARASATRISADGDLKRTRATYARIFGVTPATLTAPELQLTLPATVDEVITIAETQNPAVVAALNGAEAATRNISLQKGGLLPEIGVTADASRLWDQSSLQTGRTDAARLLGTVTVPLYNAGTDYARLKGARETATQRKLLVDAARRGARQQAVSAWASLEAARAERIARQAQVTAAELALNGVKQESKAGTRTTLDVLDAEQELLDAKVGLTRAERDVQVAGLEVLAAMGRLAPATLGLTSTAYDPTANFKDVDGAWFGQ